MIMEKNDWANVSIENALDGLSMEEIERLEAYYMAEAEGWRGLGTREERAFDVYVKAFTCHRVFV